MMPPGYSNPHPRTVLSDGAQVMVALPGSSAGPLLAQAFAF
jgi:hypothetical protein